MLFHVQLGVLYGTPKALATIEDTAFYKTENRSAGRHFQEELSVKFTLTVPVFDLRQSLLKPWPVAARWGP